MTALREPMEQKLATFDLRRLVEQHQQSVWRYLRYLGATAADADDLTQETFLSVARSPFEERSPAATAAYLRTAARNQLLMARRRAGSEIGTVELAAAEQVWADTVARSTWVDFLSVLDSCLQKIEGRGRRAVELFYRNGLDRGEIARELTMKPEGVKTLLRRTRELLRSCIERENNA